MLQIKHLDGDASSNLSVRRDHVIADGPTKIQLNDNRMLKHQPFQLKKQRLKVPKISTQSQLRKLACLREPSDQLELGLMLKTDKEDNESEDAILLAPSDIFKRHQNVAGANHGQVLPLDSAIEPSPSEKFTLFTQLPFEIRDQIWKLASHTRNVIELTWQTSELRWWSTPLSPIAPPAVFSTCQESRESTKRIQEKETIVTFGTSFNLYTDLLFLHSRQHGILNRRFMNFCMGLYEVWDSDGEAVKRLPRLAICSNMWKDMLDGMDSDDEQEDDLSVGGKTGLLRANFIGLKELILVQVMLLVEKELLDATGTHEAVDDSFDHEEALSKARENLKYEANECRVIWKVLYRGEGGKEGARANFIS